MSEQLQEKASNLEATANKQEILESIKTWMETDHMNDLVVSFLDGRMYL